MIRFSPSRRSLQVATAVMAAVAFSVACLLLGSRITEQASAGATPPNGLSTNNNQLWNQTNDGGTATPVANNLYGDALASGDFNGDGIDDLAIGVPQTAVGTRLKAGGVEVIYGYSGGLQTPGRQHWDEGSDGLPGSPRANDLFGTALATGDFNDDGFFDLAIGATGGVAGDVPGAGNVTVIYGSKSGLSATGSQLWYEGQDSAGDSAQNHDNFGAALVAGDFDNNGIDDLAIGVDSKTLQGVTNAGAVMVLYGSAGGLKASMHAQRIFYEGLAVMHGLPEGGDHFGHSLAAGDWNGDGFDDLAIGVPGEGVATVPGAGALAVVYGSADGLMILGNQLLYEDLPPPPPTPGGFSSAGFAMPEAAFGSALAAGDFNGDGKADVVVGEPNFPVGRAPNSDQGGVQEAGRVSVLFGAASGLSSTGEQHFDQNDVGGSGGAEQLDHFGSALAAGDFNSDGRSDLAIGAAEEDIQIWAGAGEVDVIYGTSKGLNAGSAQHWNEVNSGLVGVRETGDHFGQALAAGDFNGDASFDLAVGIPHDLVGEIDDAGSVAVLYGAPQPPTPTPTATITPTSPPTATPTITNTPAPTNTPTNTPQFTDTPMPSNTPLPPTDTPTRTPTEAPPGSVNCDDEVTSIDVALELQYIAGLIPALACQDVADVNGDGRINSVDVALILQYIAGIIHSL